MNTSSKWTLHDSEIHLLGGEVSRSPKLKKHEVKNPHWRKLYGVNFHNSSDYGDAESIRVLPRIKNLYSAESSLKQKVSQSTIAINSFVVGGRTDKEVSKMERVMKLKKMDGCLLHCDRYDSKRLLHVIFQWNPDLHLFDVFTFDAKDFNSEQEFIEIEKVKQGYE